MADRYFGVRMPPDLHAAIIAASEAMAVTPSEWVRLACSQMLAGAQFVASDVGFLQARGLAIRMAYGMLEMARAQLPDTIEEAIARFGAPQPVSGGPSVYPIDE